LKCSQRLEIFKIQIVLENKIENELLSRITHLEKKTQVTRV
jgi:hypothetical protein